MAEVRREDGEVNARIVYWGVEGAGKTTNLHAVYSRLRPDHRGELVEAPTRLDPTATYEILPIELGAIAGMRTQMKIIAVPGAREHAPTRKQLLDRMDGLVLVIDAQRDRIDENLASFEELRQALEAYGRSLEDVPLVIQYNKRDLADPYALEELHRKLDLRGAAVFEAVATDGTGVLQTLSTISKRVIRTLREQAGAPEPTLDAPPAPAPSAPTELPPPRLPEPTGRPAPQTSAQERMEAAMLQEDTADDVDAIEATARRAEDLLDTTPRHVPGEIERSTGARMGPDLCIVSVGQASRAGDRSVRVPVVLGDAEGGASTVVLTIQLDPLVDAAGD